MNLIDKFKNAFLYTDKYKTDSEAVIIACYFNPQGNPYRRKAFNAFYESIKHLNHRIVEGVIGDTMPELPLTDSITRIHTKDLLWHKEALLNSIVKTLPTKFKYVFWLDTDVLFTNKDWLVQSVEELKHNNIIQPFEYCVHLNEGEMAPDFDVQAEKKNASDPAKRHPRLWRSFCANFKTNDLSCDTNYDKHGHVGFAWGARREVLEIMPLYDKALIGGADHIIAHAAAGQIGHSCIQKSFTADLEAINEWSEDFERLISGKISYVVGDLHHIWHGNLEDRQYLKRIQDYTPKAKKITKKDANGLYVADELGDDTYMAEYFEKREPKGFQKVDISFGRHKDDVNKAVFTGKKKFDAVINEKGKMVGRPIDANTSRQEYVEINRQEQGLDLTDFVEAVIINEVLNDDNGYDNFMNEDLNIVAEPGFDGGFGGGDFSGGGSGGSWDESASHPAQEVDYSQSENFS